MRRQIKGRCALRVPPFFASLQNGNHPWLFQPPMHILWFARKIKSASAHNSKSIRYDTSRQTPRTERLRQPHRLLADLPRRCKKVLRLHSFHRWIDLPFANIFTFSRTFATMLVMEKFSDSLEYISSINIHEQEYWTTLSQQEASDKSGAFICVIQLFIVILQKINMKWDEKNISNYLCRHFSHTFSV